MSGQSVIVDALSEAHEPAKKRGRIVEGTKGPEDILEKISRHCSCTVCLDIPPVALYQCKNGHLMCYTCLNHLLADSRLKDDNATCPNCRCDISMERCVRNLAAEKAVGELPTECLYCTQLINRCEIEAHERHQCQQRPTNCRYYWAGCQWRGPVNQHEQHSSACKLRYTACDTVKDVIEKTIDERNHQCRVKDNVLNLFSMDHVVFTDFQLRSFRSDDYVSRLYFESPRIRIMNEEMLLKCSISCSDALISNPTLQLKRTISFQLTVKARPQLQKDVQFMVVRAPSSDLQINHVTYLHRFTNESLETPQFLLPLGSPAEVNRFIASKFVHLRVYFFENNQVKTISENV